MAKRARKPREPKEKVSVSGVRLQPTEPEAAKIEEAWSEYQARVKARPGERLAFEAGYLAGWILPPPGEWQQVGEREWRCQDGDTVLMIRHFLSSGTSRYHCYFENEQVNSSPNLEEAKELLRQGIRLPRPWDKTPEGEAAKAEVNEHYKGPTAEQRKARILAGQGESASSAKGKRVRLRLIANMLSCRRTYCANALEEAGWNEDEYKMVAAERVPEAKEVIEAWLDKNGKRKAKTTVEALGEEEAPAPKAKRVKKRRSK